MRHYCIDADLRQQHRLAICSAERWGYERPRRWWCLYSDLPIPIGADAKELRKAFNECKKRIKPLVPVPKPISVL